MRSQRPTILDSLPRVGLITAFQSESPLHPKAREVLLDAFDQGWAEPRKIHQASRRAALLRDEARQSLATSLQVRGGDLHFLGEASLGFHLGISGLLNGTMYHSATSRSEVFAIAHGVNAVEIPFNSPLPLGAPGDVLAWQAVNGETGIRAADPQGFTGRIFLDATATHSGNHGRWDAALWDSGTWTGPRGLGIFVVKSREVWKNPLPHLDQRVAPGDRSIPLVLASAVALENFAQGYAAARARIRTMNERIRHFVLNEIGDVDIAGDFESMEIGEPAKLSLSFLYVDAEQLVSELDRAGFAVDSGSACSSLEMKPSHVLAAMGLLTHGNVRLTLRAEHTDSYIESFLVALKECVLRLR